MGTNTSTVAEKSALTSPLLTIKDDAQLATSLARLGVKLSLISSREARLRARIERNQAKVDRDKLRLGQLNARDQRIAERYALAIYRYARTTLSIDPEAPLPEVLSLKEPTGLCRFYLASKGKLVFTQSEEATAREIFTMFPELFFELVRVEVKKDALKGRPEVLEALRTAFAQRGLFFSIEPNNTGEALSLPVSRFEHLLAG